MEHTIIIEKYLTDKKIIVLKNFVCPASSPYFMAKRIYASIAVTRQSLVSVAFQNASGLQNLNKH